MQRTPIGWVQNQDRTQGYTWNPLTGCLQGCHYCYARRLARRFGKTQEERGFKPVFHPERLVEPQEIKKPSTIFVCSMADLFGEWVPDKWIEQTMKTCRKAPQHRYIFLTKNGNRYGRYPLYAWPPESLLGVTRTNGLAIPPIKVGLQDFFLSAEPLLGPIDFGERGDWFWNWVIVGAQTGPGAVRPKREWVEDIIKVCQDNHISLFLKDNLLKIYPDLPRIQEVPWLQRRM